VFINPHWIVDIEIFFNILRKVGFARPSINLWMKAQNFPILLGIIFLWLVGCNSEQAAEGSDTSAVMVDSLIGFEEPMQIAMPPNKDTLDHTDSLLRNLEKEFIVYQKRLPTLTINRQKYYIVQGDERITEQDLFMHWTNYVYKDRAKLGIDTSGFGRNQNKMILGQDRSGNSLNWPPGTKLKFSVTRSSFPNLKLYQQARNEFLIAAKDWEGLCNVKLEYHPEKDGAPNSLAPPIGLNFTLVHGTLGPTDSRDVLAVAFYKNEPYRKIHVFPAYFENRAVSRSGVLRHEIGHVLGFRHEHISPDAPVECLGMEAIGKAKPLTPYDYNSVMHYMCGLFDNTQMIFTRKDTIGSQRIYGKPIL
jgi:hypothetical protein